MIKKLLFVLVMFPVIGFAQEAQKIAYMNYFDVIVAMPEYKQLQDSVQKVEEAYREDMKSMMDDYTAKVSDFVAKQDSLIEGIRIRKQQEIEDIRARYENFQQFASQNLEELQSSLFVPIETKARKAITDVGAENNFLYIINSPQILMYTSPNAVDATPLIKKKLGI